MTPQQLRDRIAALRQQICAEPAFRVEQQMLFLNRMTEMTARNSAELQIAIHAITDPRLRPEFRSASENLWLPRASYVLRRLRFRAFSASLQSCRLSPCRCSTRFDFSSSRAPRCTWNSSRLDTNWPSSIDRGARVFASRRPIESCGRGSRAHGAGGARRFTSSNRRRSSPRVSPLLDLEKPTPHRPPSAAT
jgi:hypothetical protein